VIIMIWNELDYTTQMKVIDRIVELLRDEDDDSMQDGIIAAVHELEIWSNSPIAGEEEPYVAQAHFVESEKEFLRFVERKLAE
jgi:hypothetical protein